MIKLTIPFPDQILNPNRIKHWAQKSPIKRAHRENCKKIAESLGITLPNERVHLSLVFYPPANRGDVDNFLSSCKSSLDGLADGFGINDKNFRPITIDIATKDKQNPRVEITIYKSE